MERIKRPRTKTTLFLVSSVDGKISSGDSDRLDVDRDWKTIPGVKEGLSQYYDLERKTDLFSMNTGRVMEKIGVNNLKQEPKKMPVSFIIIDSEPHLNARGVTYLSKWVKRLYLVTTNNKHPAYALQKKLGNIEILHYNRKIDFAELFERLRRVHGIKRLTVQSGGTLNATLVRSGLIDRFSLVIAPLIVGGTTTPTCVDGEALHNVRELTKLKPMRLVTCKKLKHSYVHLTYDVLN